MDLTAFNLDMMSDATVFEPWLAFAPTSVVLQVIAIVRLRGVLRSLGVILGVMTGVCLGLIVAAYCLDPGNLWELLLRLVTPPVFVLTVGLLLLGAILRPTQVSSAPASLPRHAVWH